MGDMKIVGTDVNNSNERTEKSGGQTSVVDDDVGILISS
jgi:hypothetical protein